MLTLPNVLSLSRFPAGVLVVLTAVHHAWGLAFGVLLLGCLTDLADGYIAMRWDMASDFGADVLEPVCDLALTTGAIVGLVLTHKLPFWVVIGMIIVAGVVQVINSFMVETRLFTHFGQWFMPVYFLAVIWAGLIWYAELALPAGPFMVFDGLQYIATSETSGRSSPSRSKLIPTTTSKTPARRSSRISMRSSV